ncbi:60S ribosomal protein L6 [Neolecta irregularis DAH-3]|uniref:60S ribosomal protein L6 n=1 Tax=Neolecta irregularis (strain DAH-3) TaxID=1198029 RepID=A0A1U7LWA5_NEOID|nr:60S ribosomal protein L6 [Neolecta irregularis DAH-3]|eukprot:OLL26832.1 60S ribosomal protein L6 [Neolecta irregularis DAH-3]
MSSKQIGGTKNGSSRNTVPSSEKASRWYPAEDIKAPKKSRKTQKPTKFRNSLTPGAVVIILAGRFRGKRVVVLKQLNDTIVVTGPFKINGVPLRRINPAYVIATQTKIELPSALNLAKFDDKYFAREKEPKRKAEEKEFFGDKAEKKELPRARTEDQKVVDKALVSVIKKTQHLSSYLASSFSLSKGDRPHLMQF